jgi:hypothetical protein
MRSPGSTTDKRRNAYHDPDADNTAAVITITGVSDQYHCIAGITWSYDGDTDGILTITDGTDTFKIHVTRDGPGPIGYAQEPLFVGAKGATVTITLSAVASQKGTINALYY